MAISDHNPTALAAAGLLRSSEEVGGGEMYWLPVEGLAGVNLALVQSPGPCAAEPGKNTFPLKRLDHLAAVAPDLDEKTRFWTDVLGVPLAGEVKTPTMVVRQFRIGDAAIYSLRKSLPASDGGFQPVRIAEGADREAWR